MTDKKFNEKLIEESKLRESIFEDTLKSIEDYKNKQLKEEQSQEKYRLDEIKYKTTIKELNDCINIYNNKIEELEKQVKVKENEIMSLKKANLKNETDLTVLKSIVDLLTKEYGVDTIVEITNLDKKKIESYIGE